jgi:hypothetical protein
MRFSSSNGDKKRDRFAAKLRKEEHFGQSVAGSMAIAETVRRHDAPPVT